MSATWLPTMPPNQRVWSRWCARSSPTYAGAATQKLIASGSRPASEAARRTAAIIQAAKHAFVPSAMSASEAAGGTLNLLVPLAIILGTFVLGFYVFNREAPRIAEEL